MDFYSYNLVCLSLIHVFKCTPCIHNAFKFNCTFELESNIEEEQEYEFGAGDHGGTDHGGGVTQQVPQLRGELELCQRGPQAVHLQPGRQQAHTRHEQLLPLQREPEDYHEPAGGARRPSSDPGGRQVQRAQPCGHSTGAGEAPKIST